MKKIIPILSMLFFVVPAHASLQKYYNKYPVGTIAENLVYELFNQNREKLRQCHVQYLEKIPGAFDGLSAEF